MACRFEAPEDKLAKLEVILTKAVTSGAITFRMLEKLAGKCTSLSVAVPVAALYTHQMRRKIVIFQRTEGRKKSMEIDIPKNGGLMFELTNWLEVRQRFNGASWYGAEHKMGTLTGATHASSSGWGGLIRNPRREVFRAGRDFPVDLAGTHISLREGYALQQTLEMYCAAHSAQNAGSTLVSDIDNKVFHDSFKRDRSKKTLMHEMIVDSFWLQGEHDFILKLRWVNSKANAEADALSRPDSDDYVRFDAAVFGSLYTWTGGFDMDLMATPAFVHQKWVAGQRT